MAAVSIMPGSGDVVVQLPHKKMHLSRVGQFRMGSSLPARSWVMRSCVSEQGGAHAPARDGAVPSASSAPSGYSRRERSLEAIRAFFDASRSPDAGAGGIDPSPVAGKTIDAAQIDLVELIEHIERPDGLSPASLDGRRRALLECMRALAGEAYTENFQRIAPIGQLNLCADRCTPALKLWEAAPAEHTAALVLGFSGTRMTDSADLLCDLKGQIPELHGNPLHESLPPLGHVGAGWQERWCDEATKLRGGERLAGILAKRSLGP